MIEQDCLKYMCVCVCVCVCVCLQGEQRFGEEVSFFRVEGSRAVIVGTLDWSQVVKHLQCESKLLGFLFDR